MSEPANPSRQEPRPWRLFHLKKRARGGTVAAPQDKNRTGVCVHPITSAQRGQGPCNRVWACDPMGAGFCAASDAVRRRSLK